MTDPESLAEAESRGGSEPDRALAYADRLAPFAAQAAGPTLAAVSTCAMRAARETVAPPTSGPNTAAVLASVPLTADSSRRPASSARDSSRS